MASFGPKGSKTEPANSEPGSDEHFRQMRDRMNKEREAFFQDSPSSFFGRESPFFRSRPGFEDFQSGSPNFQHTGFPATSDSMDSRKYSAPTQTTAAGGPAGPSPTSRTESESIPIKVFHEHPRSNNDKYRYGGSGGATGNSAASKTADIPSAASRTMSSSNDSAESPRVTRAHSEPPKTGFNQRPQQMKTTIPLGKLSEQMEHNLSTSASDPSVPASNNNHPGQQPEYSNRETPTTATHPTPPPQAGANVRHIPIFVEGRDKPVIGTKDIFTNKSDDKNINNKQVPNRQQHMEHPAVPPPPPPKRPTDFVRKVDIKNSNPSLAPNSNLNQEPTSPLSPIPSDQPIPMGYVTETDHNTTIPSSSSVNNGATASVAASETSESTPSALPPGPIPMPCSSEYLQGNTTTSNANSATPNIEASVGNKSTTNNVEIQQQENPANDKKPDPCLDKLAKIQANVGDLVKQLEKFKGVKDSKEYKYLDEMLTRNLLALDGLNLEGRDDVRQVRKESIKSINRCLSILESKAASGGNDQAVKNNEILSDLASSKD